MQVVYSPAHLGARHHGRDVHGHPGPGQRGRRAGRADPDRARRRRRLPDAGADRARRGADHGRPRPGPRPVPRGGLVRAARAVASTGRSCRPTRTRTAPCSRGCPTTAVAALVREPVHAGGRAGFWGLDSAAPLVAGTYAAARAAVDVALTDRGPRARRRVGRLRPVPAARPSRGPLDVRRLLLLQQRRHRRRGDRPGDRRAGRDPRRRLPPRQRHASRSSGDAATSGTSRSTPTRTRDYPYFLGRADETGEGDGAGENLNIPLPAGHDQRGVPGRASTGRSRRSRPCRVRWSSSRSGSTRTGSIRSASFALTTDVYHEIGRRTAALGRRLVILQEGGYHRPSLGENARAWLRGAEGRPFDPLPVGGFGPRGAVAGVGVRRPSRRSASPLTEAGLAAAVDELAARDAGPGRDRRPVRAAAAVGPRGRASRRSSTSSSSSRSRSRPRRPRSTGCGSSPTRSRRPASSS